MAAALRAEESELSDEEKREIAIAEVVAFCGERRQDTEGDWVNRSIKAVRTHFDSLKADKRAKQLGVSWQELIDELLRKRTIRVTNGFVWLP